MSPSPGPSRFLVVVVCAMYAFLRLAANAAAEPKQEAGKLDGTWKLVSVEQEGEEMGRDDDVRLVFADGQVMYAGERLAGMVTYAASTPKGIDLSFYAPKNDYEGIYVIDRDELKVCLNTRTTGPKERPSDFETKEKTNLRVLRFERMAPSAAGSGTVRGYVGMALARETETILIQGVLENSPAEKAGLRTGDVVVSVGGQAVGDLLATVDLVRRQMPGSDVAIRVLREGKEKEFTVRVAVFPFALLGILGDSRVAGPARRAMRARNWPLASEFLRMTEIDSTSVLAARTSTTALCCRTTMAPAGSAGVSAGEVVQPVLGPAGQDV